MKQPASRARLPPVSAVAPSLPVAPCGRVLDGARGASRSGPVVTRPSFRIGLGAELGEAPAQGLPVGLRVHGAGRQQWRDLALHERGVLLRCIADRIRAEGVEGFRRRVPVLAVVPADGPEAVACDADRVLAWDAAAIAYAIQDLSEEARAEHRRKVDAGEVQLALVGQKYLNDGGSITLTSGVLAR